MGIRTMNIWDGELNETAYLALVIYKNTTSQFDIDFIILYSQFMWFMFSIVFCKLLKIEKNGYRATKTFLTFFKSMHSNLEVL